ncbi:methyltransferase domain-containing protein [Iningainema tapete]|uniref:Methyltransferase domain-containing protein n=1 Tax=Iningainema tapete BLCC-T55 TaxID=2748662 RepID=A0A8J6XT42_9CYAN|nr:methyltransferase domain-containing protein [Iningainema tapete]MBD2773263.1 methyltransferase domain-containing protein [Iningainema tapete BLCC-T55]
MKKLNYYLSKAIKKIPVLGSYQIVPRAEKFNAETFYNKTSSIPLLNTYNLTKIHYACGENFIADWLNVDFTIKQGIIPKQERSKYVCSEVNLIVKHPFPDNCFSFGFAEDFLEHLQQADSIVFLSECFRTLIADGVLRLSFPGLEGVLNKHYKVYDYRNTIQAKQEAYTMWEHLHFYSREELRLVAEQIGYRAINFVDYGVSNYPELNGLDTRKEQIGLNTYVELVK